MSTLNITVTKKGLRTNSKLVQEIEEYIQLLLRTKCKTDDPEAATFTVEMDDPPESRADRLDAAAGWVEDAEQEIQELRDELQNWRDNLPENMQGGDKASQLDEAISALDQIESDLENVSFEVEFPSMMG